MTGTFHLPGGYIDRDDVVHREIELAPLTGWVEEYFHELPAGTSSASATTGLLQRSIRRVGSVSEVHQDLAHELLIGDREFAVMKLREMTWGPNVTAVLRCPNEECAKPLEISLSLEQMAVEPRPGSSRYFRFSGSAGVPEDIQYRLPNGSDQEAVAGIKDGATAVMTLLARCTGLEPSIIEMIPAATRNQIEEEIERLAPQAEAELEATCPECGRLFSSQISWPEVCLDEMQHNSATIEREVHFLALHYHWRESDVLSMTHAKRRRYLALLEEEMERRDED
jgi:hypothetical protein